MTFLEKIARAWTMAAAFEAAQALNASHGGYQEHVHMVTMERYQRQADHVRSMVRETKAVAA